MVVNLLKDIMHAKAPVHPKGANTRILLSSVFGPYAQNDEYGSRKINPMELYHNQVTRVQGPFSPRSFHRSFGLMFLHANIDAPCTLLDFPTMNRFIEELKTNSYDVVGISGILPNVGKIKKMCELVRQYLPKATVVVGGHAANMPNIHDLVCADYIVRGEGVQWFRKFLGQDLNKPIRHPVVNTAFGMRVFGMELSESAEDKAATLIPSVGCPMGCNFCSTSHMFGGKGKFVNFYETGDDLFKIMCQLEEKLKVQSFGVMDENFLLHRPRALRLLELMEEHHKSWAWIGLEGNGSQYVKLTGIDTRQLVRDLQSHGIRILGSSIIGLEEHAHDTIDAAIDWAVSHDTDFHQFMLYTPLPGTPLYLQHRKEGTLLSEDEIPYADIHGQLRFNYRHKNIRNGEETEFLLRAFRRDFEVNGPSIARMIRTTLLGWKRYKNHPNARIQRRYARESRNLATTFAGTIWAMRKWYHHDKPMKKKLDKIFQDLVQEFGWKVNVFGFLIGSVEYITMKLEVKRLARGWTYEPATICEKNARAFEFAQAGKSSSKHGRIPAIQWVACT